MTRADLCAAVVEPLSGLRVALQHLEFRCSDPAPDPAAIARECNAIIQLAQEVRQRSRQPEPA